MKKSMSVKLRPVLLAFFCMAFFKGISAADENRLNAASLHRSAGKVRLQIRISEAKKKKDSIGFYRSVARRQQREKINGFSPRGARSEGR